LLTTSLLKQLLFVLATRMQQHNGSAVVQQLFDERSRVVRLIQALAVKRAVESYFGINGTRTIWDI
jgi:cyanophycinase-like exopeptidase